MSLLTFTAADPLGSAAGAAFTIRLTSSTGVDVIGHVAGIAVYAGERRVEADATGAVEVDLVANRITDEDDTTTPVYDQAHTYYTVTRASTGQSVLIEVTEEDRTLRESMAEDPEPLDPTVASQLVDAAIEEAVPPAVETAVADVELAGAVTGSLGATVIGADQVTATQIATDAVTADGIAADAVGTAEIADDAVTTAQIAASAVTAAELAASAATTEKIADENVTTPKVADQNVTASKLVIEDENGLIFDFDPSGLADADVLPAPWVDAHDNPDLTLLEDRIGIRDGKIQQIGFQGPNYTVPIPGDILSGWRSLAGVDCGLSDGFMVQVMMDRTDINASGPPMACFVADDTDHAISGPFIVEPLVSWYELGPVGRVPADFHYFDTCPADLSLIPDQANIDARLYVLHGWAWVTVNGVRRLGPVQVPAGLIGSRVHGIAPDYGDDVDAPCAGRVRVYRYDGPVALDYPPAAITAGTITKGTAATSRAVPIPNGIDIGDWVAMPFSANATITTPTGWTLAASVTEGAFRARLYARKVDGTEPWFGLPDQTLTVAHGSSISSGVILRLADANPHRPLTATLSSDTTNDTTATIPTGIAWGPHRSSLAFVAVPADRTVTFPTGWTTLAATTPGGAAITLAVATVADWSDPPAPLELSASYVSGGRETGVQLATLSTASTCLTGHAMVGPDQEGAPV